MWRRLRDDVPMSRKYPIRLVLYAGALAAYLAWQPLHNGWVRYGLPLALAMTWAGAVMLAWERRKWRVAVMGLPLLVMLPFIMPGRELDAPRLTDRYLASMRGYEGTRYRWGGEGGLGIDCSGLPRRALREALLDQALRGNGRAARLWLEQWWYDTSAKAMSEGYRGFTRPTGVTGELVTIDPATVKAGDLAVTQDGRHVLIHLGDGAWIQADPGEGKVVIGRPGKDQNPWFRSGVTVHRWEVFW
ncbi:NlpC/P60 family protein [Luteolibacter flavescens]|uniref:NlpC/P60 family protein n=1 Tax=Luteolibacter flavescens TaxID=1859460 RepID=A0ABT3FM80_9BACT|nr:NlpC/P60 family protein [Luteolibacter flavescens]MCW1884685.1 NlpC/P60 family protein [Luteolibacter flavescens]